MRFGMMSLEALFSLSLAMMIVPAVLLVSGAGERGDALYQQQVAQDVFEVFEKSGMLVKYAEYVENDEGAGSAFAEEAKRVGEGIGWCLKFEVEGGEKGVATCKGEVGAEKVVVSRVLALKNGYRPVFLTLWK